MAQITAALVKDLREKTGAGMMDCKKALAETDGDIDAAIDWLRTKGLAKAAKKSGRIAAEGLVAIYAEGNKATVLELNSETDFVARNTEFQSLALNLAKSAQSTGAANAESFANETVNGKPVSETVTEAIATIGENLTLRRLQTLSVDEGVIASYIHNAVAPNLGKIGVLVALKSSGNKEKLQELGKSVAMHIAATNPVALTGDQVDQDILAREKGVLTEKAREQGKPDHVIEKIVESGIKSYLKEVSLVDQGFVMDPSKSVAQAVKESEGAAGAPIEITGFVRYGLGEGIEKEESDFAAEVAAAAKVG